MPERFTLHDSPELLAEIFGLQDIPTILDRYNIAPNQTVAAVRKYGDGLNRLDLLRWGLIPSWAKTKSVGNDMITACSETVSEKPAFRQGIKFRRCLVVASGFYAWKEGRDKLPYYVHLKCGSPMVFAGLWESWKYPGWEAIESCAILTAPSNKLIEPVQGRMPVILHPQEYDTWLDREITNPEQLKQLYQPYPADLMEMYSVSQLVNSNLKDGPELIRPLSEL